MNFFPPPLHRRREKAIFFFSSFSSHARKYPPFVLISPRLDHRIISITEFRWEIAVDRFSISNLVETKKKKKNSELESVPFLRIRRFSRSEGNHEADKCRSFYPRDLNSSLLSFSLVFIYGFTVSGVKFFPLVSIYVVHLFWNIERARQQQLKAATIKKFAQKFFLQHYEDQSSSKQLDERSEKFGRKRTPSPREIKLSVEVESR